MTTMQKPKRTKYHFPPFPGEYASWLDNFYKKLDIHKVLLNIAASDLNRVKRFNLGLGYYGKCISDFDPFVSKCIRNRNIMIYGSAKNPNLKFTQYEQIPTGPTVPLEQVPPNEHAWIVVFVGKLRDNPNMNATVSKELGIDPRPVSKYDGEPLILKGKVINGQAQLNCPLKNLKGYEVWRRDTPSGVFIKIGISISRFYLDTDELPEGVNTAQHTYIVRMVGNDNKPVGLPSEEVTLVVFRPTVPS